MNENYIGVMTGNSMDAADAVLVDFSRQPPRIVKSASAPISRALAEHLYHLATSDTLMVGDLLSAQNALTDVCAAAVAALEVSAADEVQAVGCHGQSIAHRPHIGATWQILNGARLAEQCGLNVVCDFRARDLASGGQGAPLAPFFHQQYFADRTPCAVINIGGIANITHLAADGSISSAYDTGPGMLLLDAFYRRCHPEQGEQSKQGEQDNRAYDVDGAFAEQGSVNADLLQTLLAQPYFSAAPPKSCGREEFSLALLPQSAAALPPADVQATLLELTARSIAAAVCEESVFLCGGGSANVALRRRLGELLSAAPQTTADAGLPPQLVEACAFAYLARCFIRKQPLVAAAVTGGQTRLAGALYPC